jgi:hypothetical protein
VVITLTALPQHKVLRQSRLAFRSLPGSAYISEEEQMHIDSQPNLQTMLNNGPEWLDEWLRQFEEGKQSPDNWMNGVSEAAAQAAERKASLEWADIAIRASDLLARVGPHERELALDRAMRLRASLIVKMGSSPGHPVLDNEIILDWFRSELESPMDVVKQRIARWHDSQLPVNGRLPIDQVRQLRALKNRLRIVKLLADPGEVPIGSDTSKWLEISDQLP